ncbi:MAG: TraR/DksA family transcriptional regulator, partial [Longimicrobiales bacterium]
MSAHLSSEQIDELRTELERQLARLEKSMKVTDEALRTVELDQTAVGRLSRMDSLQNQSLSRGLRDREIVRLSQIRAALLRVE